MRLLPMSLTYSSAPRVRQAFEAAHTVYADVDLKIKRKYAGISMPLLSQRFLIICRFVYLHPARTLQIIFEFTSETWAAILFRGCAELAHRNSFRVSHERR